MFEKIPKRVRAGLWIILAGSIAQVLTMLIENISEFNLSETATAISILILTAIVSQITKYMNVAK